MNKLIKNTTLFLLLLVGFISCGVEDDACLTLVCLNDGTCVSGTCACPEGYEGQDCSIEQTPVSMSIVGINITKYPTVRPDSTSWDSLDMTGPDVFFAFHEGTGATYDSSTDFISSTATNSNGQAIEINAAPPYVVTALSSNWSLDLWDADGNTEEYMDGVIFIPSAKIAGLPTTFEVETPTVKATFFVQWDF